MTQASTKLHHGPGSERDCEECGYPISGVPDNLGVIRCPECGHPNYTVPDLTGRHLDKIIRENMKRERQISWVLLLIGAGSLLILIPVLGVVGALVFAAMMGLVWFFIWLIMIYGESL